MGRKFKQGLKILGVPFLLYSFLVSIKLLGTSFQLFGKGFAEQLISSYSNPFLGLFTGILATSLVQSSSTITSLIVGLVGGGVPWLLVLYFSCLWRIGVFSNAVFW